MKKTNILWSGPKDCVIFFRLSTSDLSIVLVNKATNMRLEILARSLSKGFIYEEGAIDGPKT